MDYKLDFEDLMVQTGLGALHCRHHAGKGGRIVFLHGIGSSTLDWDRLLKHLPADLDVYLVDLLGHGKSDKPRIDYTIGAQVGTIEELVMGLGLGDFYLFGHSYGGWIAAAYASRHGVGGLVLEDPGGVAEAFYEMEASGKAAEFKERLFKATMRFNENRDYVMRSILDLSFTEYKLDQQLLSGIRSRTLLIWGSADPMFETKYSGLVKARIHGSVLKIIDGAAHVPHYTHSAVVASELLEFMGVQKSI